MVPKVHFIYAPRSGPKWLRAPWQGDYNLPAVVWPNNSAHVIGYAVHVYAAQPCKYWRHEAIQAANLCALHCNGVAIDDCGHIVVYVGKPYIAQKVLKYLWAVRAQVTGEQPFVPSAEPFHQDELDWIQVAINIKYLLPDLALVDQSLINCRATVDVYDDRKIVVNMEDDDVWSWAISAPLEWGKPFVYGTSECQYRMDGYG